MWRALELDPRHASAAIDPAPHRSHPSSKLKLSPCFSCPFCLPAPCTVCLLLFTPDPSSCLCTFLRFPNQLSLHSVNTLSLQVDTHRPIPSLTSSVTRVNRSSDILLPHSTLTSLMLHSRSTFIRTSLYERAVVSLLVHSFTLNSMTLLRIWCSRCNSRSICSFPKPAHRSSAGKFVSSECRIRFLIASSD